MVFCFSGTEDQPNNPEFRSFWLPSEPDMGSTDDEGWTSYLSDSGKDELLPYVISCVPVSPDGRQYILNGDVSIIKEEYWDDWYVLQLSADYTGSRLHWGFEWANYILLFNEQCGFLVTVGGTSDIETLEHIARELEIRDSGKAVGRTDTHSGTGQLDIGRG